MSGHHTPVNPLAGEPPTVEYVEDDGTPVIRVDAIAREPFRMKAAGILFMLTLIGALCAYGALQDGSGLPEQYRVPYWSGLVVACVLLIVLPATRLAVKFTPSQILTRRGWFGGEWQAFDVAHEHSFVMTPHRKAEEEARAHQRESRIKPSANPEVLYGRSFHLFLDYRKQRYLLMTVYGDQEAQRIFMRLRSCADIAKGQAGKGGSATKPDDEWRPGPGRVPGARR